MAHVAHTVRLSAYVCHALRQFGDAKSPHTPLVVQMVDAQSSENCTTDRASDPSGRNEQNEISLTNMYYYSLVLLVSSNFSLASGRMSWGRCHKLND